MALFVNNGDEHVTLPDGRGGALIVPAGCEVVEGPDGALVALPRQATAPVEVSVVVSFDDDAGDALSAVIDGLIADGSLAEAPQGGPVDGQLVTLGDGSPELFIPADDTVAEPGPFADPPLVVADVTDLEPSDTDRSTTVSPPPADEPVTAKRRRGGSAA